MSSSSPGAAAGSDFDPPPDPATTLNDLLHRRLILILGKGGVGRTSVCRAFGAVAAGRDLRTLVIETDPRTPIAAAHGAKSTFKPSQAAPHLWLMQLDRQASLEEYLGFVVARPILRAVFASSLYQCFVHAAPALRELMMIGKVYHEVERRAAPRWDLVVVDLPASGQALSMIGMPFAARETFANNLVGREAGEVARLLRDREKCAILVVTTADALALTETLEIHRRLEGWGLATAAVVFNRLTAARFEAGDIARMVERGTAGHRMRHLDDLAAIARAELRRRVRERRALGILKRQIGAPILQLEEERGSGAVVAERLAARLANS
jgi:anion-transporting  ArsA/GET3 family ATPase